LDEIGSAKMNPKNSVEGCPMGGLFAAGEPFTATGFSMAWNENRLYSTFGVLRTF
jgi:hypothetical protein